MEGGLFFHLVVDVGLALFEFELQLDIQFFGSFEFDFHRVHFQVFFLQSKLFLLISVPPLHDLPFESLDCLVKFGSLGLVLSAQIIQLALCVGYSQSQLFYLRL